LFNPSLHDGEPLRGQSEARLFLWFEHQIVKHPLQKIYKNFSTDSQKTSYMAQISLQPLLLKSTHKPL